MEERKPHLLRTISGTYFPSFFCVRIDEIGPDEEIYRDDKFSTIIHELLHFVQDVSTSSGYITIQNTSNLIADFYTTNKIGQVVLPYVSTDPVKTLNRDLFSFYFGEASYELVHKDSMFSLRSEEFELEPGIVGKYHTVEATYLGVPKTFRFTGIAIMEGMASIFENWFFAQERELLTFPYDLPQIVAKLLYPEFAADIRNTFALCDASLLYYDSADVFIKCLDLMKQEKFLPTSSDSVHKFVIEHVTLAGSSILFQVKMDASNAITSILNVLNSAALEVARSWVSSSILHYSEIRLQKPHFLVDLLYSEDKQKALIEFIGYFSKYGSPIIYDNGKDSILLVDRASQSGEDDLSKMEYWIVLKSIYESVFYTGKYECPFPSRCGTGNCLTRDANGKIENLCIYKYGKKIVGVESFI